MLKLLLSLALLSPTWQAQGASTSLPDLPALSLDGFDAAARRALEEAYQNLQTQPNDSQLNGRLAMLLHAYEQTDLARAWYERAGRLDPEAFEWQYLSAVVELELGQHDAAIEKLRLALRLRPSYLPARIKLGDALLAAGLLQESAEVYRSVLKDSPQSWLARYGLGQSLLASRQLEAAVQQLEQAVAAPGGFGSAHYALAMAYRDLGKRDEARRHLQQYRNLQNRWPPAGDPVMQSVRVLRHGPKQVLAEAVRLARQGRAEEAIHEHERALEMDPELVQAHANLIRLYGEKGEVQKAEDHYRKMLQLNPRHAEGHYNYGVLCSQQGRVEEAVKAFEKSLELNPHFALAHNNLGFMLERRGRPAEARRHYQEAVRNDPSYRLARFNLARMLLSSGQVASAIEELNKILEPEDDQTPRYLYALSAAYVRAGKLQQARQRASQARDLAVLWNQDELVRVIERDLVRLQKALEKP